MSSVMLSHNPTQHSPYNNLFLIGILTILLLITATSAPSTLLSNLAESQHINTDEIPTGLTTSEWQSIQNQIAARPYHTYLQEDGGYHSANPAQGWNIRYTLNGTTQLTPRNHNSPAWQWGLTLTGIGYTELDTFDTPLHLLAEENKVTYQWSDTVSEWWINETRGLEQGFTLTQRPEQTATQTSAALQLQLTWHSELNAVQSGSGVAFQDAQGATHFTYDKLIAWDANGQTLPTQMRVDATANTLTLFVEEANATYPLTIDPWIQQAFLKASNTDVEDYFGYSVAISGDTIVIGTPWEDSNATGVNGDESDNAALNSGAVYVFTRDGNSWSQQAYLKASNTNSEDAFGRSVAIAGDIIVVGANGEDSNATGVNGDESDNSESNAGAAYVFTRSGNVWNQQAYLKASNTGIGDVFGGSVAVAGDTIVVGASGEGSNATGINGNENNNSEIEAGAAYIFTRSWNLWRQVAYVKASNTDGGDHFGFSVAISGDTVVIGAPNEDYNGDFSLLSSGAAYVFTRSGNLHNGGWSQEAYLKASNMDGSDYFGLAVAVAEDTIVVGAYGEDGYAPRVNGDESDNSASNAGAAYAFIRSEGVWSQQAYLKASNAEEYDLFGISVAIAGDTIVVGADGEDSNATGVNGDESDNSASKAGAAYVFTRSGSVWSQQTYLKASNTDSADRFGDAVAIAGDTIVIVAPNEQSRATGVNGDESNNAADGAGAGYVFDTPLPTTVEISQVVSNRSANLQIVFLLAGGLIVATVFLRRSL